MGLLQASPDQSLLVSLGYTTYESLTSYFTASFAFGGTSLLIVVGVALETVRDLEAQLSMRNYKGFLK